MVKEKISELEGIAIEIIKIKSTERKDRKQNISELWENFRWPNVHKWTTCKWERQKNI